MEMGFAPQDYGLNYSSSALLTGVHRTLFVDQVTPAAKQRRAQTYSRPDATPVCAVGAVPATCSKISFARSLQEHGCHPVFDRKLPVSSLRQRDHAA